MKSKQNHFLQLYEPIHDRFERFCRARVYGEMEYCDLMNETLLVAFEKFDTLKSESAFLSFLIGISIRILGTKNQKMREERMTDAMQLQNVRDHSTSENAADIHHLYECLSQLNNDQRECIILFDLSGFSIKEIAELQNASESAVKQRLKRGREKLIEWMNFDSTKKTKEVSYE